MIETTAIGLGLAFGSAVCWSGLDISRKFVMDRMTAFVALVGLTLFQLPFLVGLMGVGEALPSSPGVFHAVVFGGFPDVPESYWGWAAGSILLNIAANLLFLRAVHISPLSLTIPYLSFTPVFTAFSGLVFLGELPGPFGWAGIVTVGVGAFLVNPGRRKQGPLAPLKALWSERGSLYMLLVALLWSVTPVLDKKAAGGTSAIWHTTVLAAGIGIVVAVGIAVRDRGPGRLFRGMIKIPGLLVFASVLNVAAMILQLAAYDFTGVAYVETVKRAVGVIGAMAAGYFIFGEGDIARRLLGALIMVIGVALIMF